MILKEMLKGDWSHRIVISYFKDALWNLKVLFGWNAIVFLPTGKRNLILVEAAYSVSRRLFGGRVEGSIITRREPLDLFYELQDLAVWD